MTCADVRHIHRTLQSPLKRCNIQDTEYKLNISKYKFFKACFETKTENQTFKRCLQNLINWLCLKSQILAPPWCLTKHQSA